MSRLTRVWNLIPSIKPSATGVKVLSRWAWLVCVPAWLQICLLLVTPQAASGQETSVGRVFRVGPGMRYERPSQVARLVHDGDTVEILPASYLNDAAVWRNNRLTLRGVQGRPHISFDAQGVIPNRKAIWVIAGDDVVVENIEFSGGHVPDRSGAGIRVEGSNLVVRNSYFHHNDFAILSGPLPGDLTIEHSEFAYQHRHGRYAHGVYVGAIRRLLFRGNYVHHTDEGHHLKSRAAASEILYNRITDESDGNASYLIDLPNCGRSLVMGNVLHQGELASNNSAIAYGAEGCEGRPQSLAVVHNSFVSGYPRGANFVRNWGRTPALVGNNLLVGGARPALGPALERGNRVAEVGDLMEAAIFDYRPRAGSTAIDAAVELEWEGRHLVPGNVYLHPLGIQSRQVLGRRPDVGAYEYRPDSSLLRGG